MKLYEVLERCNGDARVYEVDMETGYSNDIGIMDHNGEWSGRRLEDFINCEVYSISVCMYGDIAITIF